MRFLLAALGLLSAIPSASQVLTVDLAEIAQNASPAPRISVEPGKYYVQILNRVPKRDYIPTIVVRQKTIDALDPKDFTPGKTSLDGSTTPPCKAIDAAFGNLAVTQSEIAVKTLRVALRNAIAAGPGCPQIPFAEALLAQCDIRYDDPIILAAGTYLDVTLEYDPKDNQPPIKWEKIFDAGERGHWDTSYGFMFIRNGSKDYFAKALTETGKYEITQKAERSTLAFAPSIFFTWIPRSWGHLTPDLDVGPTAGLGFDLSAPTVFLGTALLYNENIGLIFGPVFHQRTRLAGEFTPGQTIGENLGSDRLLEKGYGVSVFVGASFRFGARPQGFGTIPAAVIAPPPTPPKAPAASMPTPANNRPSPPRVVSEADLAARPSVTAEAGGTWHVVAKGETLGSISQTYYRTTTQYRRIKDANAGAISDPNRIAIGMRLWIPLP